MLQIWNHRNLNLSKSKKYLRNSVGKWFVFLCYKPEIGQKDFLFLLPWLTLFICSCRMCCLYVPGTTTFDFKHFFHLMNTISTLGFCGGSLEKNLPSKAGDVGSIPMSGRSPGEGNGSSLQYSCLGNPMDRGDWHTTVHGVEKRVRHDLATKQQQPPLYRWGKWGSESRLKGYALVEE